MEIAPELRYNRSMRRPNHKAPHRFDLLYRSDALQKMAQETLDLLIVGGGITGAGIALDAASRGLKVGLVEKGDFASGTSSRSTKLIHGGLRYLKNGELALVREVGKERAIVFKNAPHLVEPVPILLPLRRSGSLTPLATSLGLWVYDRLAQVKAEERRQMLTAAETLQRVPALDGQELLAGGLYVEYRTDDARLTLDIIKSAVRFGGRCVNYAQADEFIYTEKPLGKKTIEGVKVRDRIHGKTFDVRAKVVVNATGPWVDGIRQNDGATETKKLVLTKGIHIVVPREKLSIDQILYFDVSDGRMVFAIPRGRMTYIGTTDTVYEEHLDEPVATEADIDYLLAATREMFPKAQLSRADVATTWAGLRPLIFEPNKGPSELSRRDEVFISENGLISIAGGKLTGYRKMAERVLEVVIQRLAKLDRKSYPRQGITANIPLGFLPFSDPAEVGVLIGQLEEELTQNQGPPELAERWVRRYGRESEAVWEQANGNGNPSSQPEDFLRAELRHSIAHEMTVRPADFFVRRTGMLYFQPEEITEARIDWVTEELKTHHGSELLDWESEKKAVRDLLTSHWARNLD